MTTPDAPHGACINAPWRLARELSDPGFGRWLALDIALAHAQPLPGLYLIRSRHLAAKHWPTPSSDGPSWRAPGVIYVGISGSVTKRLHQFDTSASTGIKGHPGGRWFHWKTRAMEQYQVVSDGWRDDLELATAYPPVTPPPGLPVKLPRWRNAVRVSLEAVEASIVADVMAHRVVTGCRWHLINHVDRSTYQEI